MPISGRPLLENWLCMLHRSGVSNVVVNTHYHSGIVRNFLQRERFSSWVSSVYESELLGTAGTLRNYGRDHPRETMVLVHADNWCCCNFYEFIEFHRNNRPKHTVMTMMTFRTTDPKNCGIVELDNENKVIAFHEKIENPPGNLANGAVYLLEPEVFEWLDKYPHCTDFSSEVLPSLVGNIATWENTDVHRDIGTIKDLLAVQKDLPPVPCWPYPDDWSQMFSSHRIHQLLSQF